MELMKTLPDDSIDLILNDPPFGCTDNKWDVILPLEEMWKEYDRILKPSGIVVLFACSDSTDHPFLGRLMMSNTKDFRYTLVFQKSNHSNLFLANKRPLRKHEDILVFYKNPSLVTYNPQKVSRNYSQQKNQCKLGGGEDKVNPPSILPVFPREVGGGNSTRKPVGVMKWLIESYSNIGDLVLDNTMGSGTTGVACVQTRREFIGMELNPEFFAESKERIRKAMIGEQEDFETEQGEPMLTVDEVELPPMLPTFEPKDFLTFYRSIKDRLVDDDLHSVLVKYLNQYFAIVQGKEQKIAEFEYEILKGETEEKLMCDPSPHFVTVIGVDTVRVVSMELRSEAEIKRRLRKCLIDPQTETGKPVEVFDMWSRHEDALEYRDAVFQPSKAVKPNVLNTFRGFKAVNDIRTEGDRSSITKFDELKIKPMIDHARRLCGGNENYLEYLLDLLAYPLQTGRKSNVAVIVKGLHGCGKGIFFSHLMGRMIYGEPDLFVEIAGGKQLFGNFNSHLSNKLWVVVDEPAKLNANQRNDLKNFVDRKTANVSEKYVSTKTGVEDFTNFVFCCNSVPDEFLEIGDRRFFVIQHDGTLVKHEPYFTQLEKDFAEGYKDFFCFLRTRELKHFKFGSAPPQTHLKERLRIESIDPIFQYLRQLAEGDLPEYMVFTKFFDEAMKFCASERTRPEWLKKKESLTLKKIIGDKLENLQLDKPKLVDGKTKRCIIFPPADELIEMLQQKNLWLSLEEYDEDLQAEAMVIDSQPEEEVPEGFDPSDDDSELQDFEDLDELINDAQSREDPERRAMLLETDQLQE